LFTGTLCAQEKKHVYLIPGQGADGRLYGRLRLENCDTTIIGFPVPLKHETLPQYAKRLSVKIDTTHPFYIIGVSFGGMCAVEIAKFLHPVKVIIVSSASTQSEIPFRYKFQRVIPLNRLFGGRFCKLMVPVVRPLFEPDSRTDKKVFNAMIRAKDPKFMKRSIQMIIHWNNKEAPKNIVHIHGTRDHTLPFRRMKNCIAIDKGSHMMIFTRAEELNALINAELKK
jgi:pimeloyl-ACP methyl ester carboxylesterase